MFITIYRLRRLVANCTNKIKEIHLNCTYRMSIMYQKTVSRTLVFPNVSYTIVYQTPAVGKRKAVIRLGQAHHVPEGKVCLFYKQ